MNDASGLRPSGLPLRACVGIGALLYRLFSQESATSAGSTNARGTYCVERQYPRHPDSNGIQEIKPLRIPLAIGRVFPPMGKRI